MIFSVLGFLAVVASAVAAPATSEAPGVIPLEKQSPTVIPIVSQTEEFEPNGTYKYSYETGNGIKREETSYDKILPKTGRSSGSGEKSDEDGDNSDEIHVQRGSYSYTAPDGTLISIRYIADENGFQPFGDAIPKVGGPEADTSSSVKSGRALKSDSDASASAPAIVAKSGEPDDKPAAPTSETEDTKMTSAAIEAASTTTEAAATTTNAAAITTDSAAITTHAASTTTDSASTTIETTESEATTKSADSTTPAEEATTTEAAKESTTAAAEDVSSTTEAVTESSSETAAPTTEAA